MRPVIGCTKPGMSEKQFLKCACAHCGGRIEFPAEAGGRQVDCPHCGKKTSLQGVPVAQKPDVEKPVPVPTARTAGAQPDAPEAPVRAPSAAERKGGRKCKKCGADMSSEARICVQCGAGIRKRGPLVWVLVSVVVVAAAVGGWLIWKNRQAEKSPPALVAVPIRTNKPPPAPEPPKEPKSPNDLKVSALTIEKSKSSGKDKAKTSELVYAMGTVKNDSDWQRFGVKVTCDLFDANGVKLGTATDYLQVLEPRKSWTFRALALDKKAVSARLAAIKEDD